MSMMGFGEETPTALRPPPSHRAQRQEVIFTTHCFPTSRPSELPANAELLKENAPDA